MQAHSAKGKPLAPLVPRKFATLLEAMACLRSELS
jgi:hypothetical protein